MRKSLLFFILILSFQSCQTIKNKGVFTIYLVRHSEKDVSSNNPADPSLTPCGEKRSESLSSFLSDVPLEVIYSTDYTRTKKTAKPTVLSKELELKIYNEEELVDFSKLLIKRKQDALVVGHSNTTGVLAGILVGEEIGEFDLDIYDRIYQVVFHKKRGRLHLLHTAFYCTPQSGLR
ncbi:histidine phosphatase family protein [Crocinitomicaceae bacterium]|nr:histidine phosphatase family protein [Crocinitomicaceae bacterium]